MDTTASAVAASEVGNEAHQSLIDAASAIIGARQLIAEALTGVRSRRLPHATTPQRRWSDQTRQRLMPLACVAIDQRVRAASRPCSAAVAQCSTRMLPHGRARSDWRCPRWRNRGARGSERSGVSSRRFAPAPEQRSRSALGQPPQLLQPLDRCCRPWPPTSVCYPLAYDFRTLCPAWRLSRD